MNQWGRGGGDAASSPLSRFLKGKTMKQKTDTDKKAVYIRQDGWVFTEDSLKRLVDGGHKGHDRYMESIESQIGKWHRVSRGLDRDAAEIVKGIKGVANRALFVSNAIVKESERRAKKGVK